MIFITSTLYHIKTYFKVGIAVFFNLIFPLLLLIIFGTLWGQTSSGYIPALITGVIAMNIASQGLMGVGKQIRILYENQTMRYLHGLPISKIHYFGSYTLAMALISVLSSLVLSVLASLIFDAWQTFDFYVRILGGSFFGFFCFSLLGLILSFLGGLKDGKTYAIITNILYFIMLFISDTFFPASTINPIMGMISHTLPLSYLLDLFRDIDMSFSIITLFIYISIFTVILYFLLKKISWKR